MLTQSSQVEKFQGGDSSSGALVLTARNQDLVFCLPLVGAIFGAIAASPLTSRFGRKWVVVGVYSLSYAGTVGLFDICCYFGDGYFRLPSTV